MSHGNPQSEPSARQRRFWLRMIWVSIAGIVGPPLCGLLGTIFGMVDVFSTLARSDKAHAEALAGSISISLYATWVGLLISSIAFLFLIGALIRFFTLPTRGPEAPAGP